MGSTPTRPTKSPGLSGTCFQTALCISLAVSLHLDRGQVVQDLADRIELAVVLFRDIHPGRSFRPIRKLRWSNESISRTFADVIVVRSRSFNRSAGGDLAQPGQDDISEYRSRS